MAQRPGFFDAMGWLQDYQDCLDGTNGGDWAQAAEQWLEDSVNDLPTDGTSWQRWRDCRLAAEADGQGRETGGAR